MFVDLQHIDNPQSILSMYKDFPYKLRLDRIRLYSLMYSLCKLFPKDIHRACREFVCNIPEKKIESNALTHINEMLNWRDFTYSIDSEKDQQQKYKEFHFVFDFFFANYTRPKECLVFGLTLNCRTHFPCIY